MTYDIRVVEPGDWQRVKALRLEALRDPVSRLAFGSTYEREIAMADDDWRRRAGTPAFVAVDAADEWSGSVTVLEEPGQAQLVGMYVRPAARGLGVAAELVRVGVARAWERAETARVRLWVTEANGRACAFYRRMGFIPTGVTEPHEPMPELVALELELRRP